MKRIFVFRAVILTLLLLGISCSQTEFEYFQDSLVSTKHDAKSRAIKISDFESDMKVLLEHGYDTTGVVEYDSFYLLKPAWTVSKENIRAVPHDNPNQRVKYGYVLKPDYHRLYLLVHSNDYDIKSLFKEAVEEWNNLNCSLHFKTDIDGEDRGERWGINMLIQDNPSAPGMKPGIFIGGDLVVNGYPTSQICINTKHKYWKELDRNQKKYAMMNAIGRCVGLKDTDYMADPMGSIMLPYELLETDKNLWKGFSFMDEQEIKNNLYPLDKAEEKFTCVPSAPSDKGEYTLKLYTSYEISTEYMYNWCNDTKYEIECIPVDCPSNSYTFTKLADNKFSLVFHEGGKCQVIVTAIDYTDGVRYEYKRIFKALPDKLNFEVPSNIQLGTFYDFKVSSSSGSQVDYQYDIAVIEEYFKDITNSITLEKVGNGHVRIRFNDYGAYTVKAKVTNHPEISPRYFEFTKLHRPNVECSIAPDIWPRSVEFSDAPVFSLFTTPFTYNINFTDAPVFEERMVFSVRLISLVNEWKLPERIHRSEEVEVIQHKHNKGENNKFSYQRSVVVTPHTDNNPDHFFESIPFKCEVVYPEDKCRLK